MDNVEKVILSNQALLMLFACDWYLMMSSQCVGERSDVMKERAEFYRNIAKKTEALIEAE